MCFVTAAPTLPSIIVPTVVPTINTHPALLTSPTHMIPSQSPSGSLEYFPFTQMVAVPSPSGSPAMMFSPVVSVAPTSEFTYPELTRTMSTPRSQSPSLLHQLQGDWVAFADSRNPEKYTNFNIAAAPVKRIMVHEGVCRVLFSELAGDRTQVYHLRMLPDSRVQLFSPTDSTYSFFLLGPLVPHCLQWQNEHDRNHIVSWKQIPQTLPNAHFWGTKTIPQIPSRPASQSLPRDMAPVLLARSQSRSRRERPMRPEESLVMPPENPTFVHKLSHESLLSLPTSDYLPNCSPTKSTASNLTYDVSSEFEPYSREVTPDPTLPPAFPDMHKPERESKQRLVKEVEPLVDGLIGQWYADKQDWRENRNGRFGPPVLRGEDVLFIPAKKQSALENVVEFIEAIKDNCSIVASAKVCQKKKKRQKKGFLVYLKLASSEEVQSVLEGPYRHHFRDYIQGVKVAIFEKDKELHSTKI